MEHRAIEAAAQALVDAQRTRRWIEPLAPALRPTDAATAYAIQDAGRRLSPRRLAGWKLGATSTVMQQKLGIDRPMYGPLYADAIHESPAMLRGCRVDMPFIEGEFAFRLASDLPPRTGDYARAEVLSALDAVIPAVEVVEERFADWRASTIWEKIADNAGHGAVVLGQPWPVAAAAGLADQRIRIEQAGRELASGVGAAVLGDPVDALLWLANVLSGRGIGMRAGQVVMSGSCTGLVPVATDAPIVAYYGHGHRVELGLSA